MAETATGRRRSPEATAKQVRTRTRQRETYKSLAPIGDAVDAFPYALPHTFAQVISDGEWIPYAHLKYLSMRIARPILRGGARIIIEIPPRHGKSELGSKYVPLWGINLCPAWRVILSSYEADFAESWGSKARDLAIANENRLSFKVHPSRRSGSWWETTVGGGMMTAGVGGAITGKGGNLLICDDPVKNWEQAQSATYRQKTIDWFNSTFYTRAEPGASIIIIQTRWHQLDLAGYLLESHEDDWTEIKIPAIAEAEDPLGRPEKAALCPERYPVEELRRIYRAVGSKVWSALYQQRPSPEEGNMFLRKSFRYYSDRGVSWELFTPEGSRHVPKEGAAIFQTCDPAGRAREQSDFFVLGTWAFTKDGDLILLDLQHLHIEGPQQPGLIRAGYQRWKPAIIGIEPAHIGLTLFQALQQEGLPVVPLKPDTDKVTRSLPASARYESGNVYHPHGATWLNVLENELVNFPNAEHDDCVDVVSYAAILAASGILRGKRGGRVTVIG